jgi:hypothetical protein
MDLIQINNQLLSVKRDHMKNTIKYRKVVKKIVSWINLPDVIYKFICNYVGSSKFPDLYRRFRGHPHSFPKNIALSPHKTLEETMDQAQ